MDLLSYFKNSLLFSFLFQVSLFGMIDNLFKYKKKFDDWLKEIQDKYNLDYFDMQIIKQEVIKKKKKLITKISNIFIPVPEERHKEKNKNIFENLYFFNEKIFEQILIQDYINNYPFFNSSLINLCKQIALKKVGKKCNSLKFEEKFIRKYVNKKHQLNNIIEQLVNKYPFLNPEVIDRYKKIILVEIDEKPNSLIFEENNTKEKFLKNIFKNKFEILPYNIMRKFDNLNFLYSSFIKRNIPLFNNKSTINNNEFINILKENINYKFKGKIFFDINFNFIIEKLERYLKEKNIILIDENAFFRYLTGYFYIKNKEIFIYFEDILKKYKEEDEDIVDKFLNYLCRINNFTPLSFFNQYFEFKKSEEFKILLEKSIDKNISIFDNKSIENNDYIIQIFLLNYLNIDIDFFDKFMVFFNKNYKNKIIKNEYDVFDIFYNDFLLEEFKNNLFYVDIKLFKIFISKQRDDKIILFKNYDEFIKIYKNYDFTKCIIDYYNNCQFTIDNMFLNKFKLYLQIKNIKLKQIPDFLINLMLFLKTQSLNNKMRLFKNNSNENNQNIISAFLFSYLNVSLYLDIDFVKFFDENYKNKIIKNEGVLFSIYFDYLFKSLKQRYPNLDLIDKEGFQKYIIDYNLLLNINSLDRAFKEYINFLAVNSDEINDILRAEIQEELYQENPFDILKKRYSQTLEERQHIKVMDNIQNLLFVITTKEFSDFMITLQNNNDFWNKNKEKIIFILEDLLKNKKIIINEVLSLNNQIPQSLKVKDDQLMKFLENEIIKNSGQPLMIEDTEN